MLSNDLIQKILEDDFKFKDSGGIYITPAYDPKNYYRDICSSNYFEALIVLRHYIKIVSDYYFGTLQGAKNVDLFMLTNSVSSPMGPGSDSEPMAIQFGEYKTFLVDSSQFGFEPLLLNNFEKVYCYLPSMRGEDCDKRHLSQFYHCEMEMRGVLTQLLPIIEGYILVLVETLLLMKNIINKISMNPEQTIKFFKNIISIKEFPRITFDDAIDVLIKNNKKELVNFTSHGNDISSSGELELMKILKLETPLWLTKFDRDRVPFYQKPDPENSDKTINADLIFPSIFNDSFGGEIVGSGQRQDNPYEMYESLRRQNNISSHPYEWYIDLRRQPNYKVTSGFGIGIERFIAWALCKDNIRDVIIYPRIKNESACP